MFSQCADDALLRAEREALEGAGHWIGPHAGMLALAGDKAHALSWRLPVKHIANTERHPGPMRIYFPASSLMRKGAWELSAAMGRRDRAAGGEPARWQDIALHRIDDVDAALSLCDAAVLPAWVEHELRVLIATIARGIPVIATAACGLGRLQGWPEVAASDVDALRAALKRVQGTQPNHPRHA